MLRKGLVGTDLRPDSRVRLFFSLVFEKDLKVWVFKLMASSLFLCLFPKGNEKIDLRPGD